jgi:hypothetical protein
MGFANRAVDIFFIDDARFAEREARIEARFAE